jgi:deoxycytidine triphosphate deaminase
MQYHYMRLVPNMKIGQMIFERVTPVPRDQSYAVRGQYNGTSDVAMSRGVR